VTGKFFAEKKWLIAFFTLLFPGLLGVFFLHTAYAVTLSCTITTSCPSGVVIYRMSGTTNAHAELPSQTNYSQLVCSSGWFDLLSVFVKIKAV
jgi:hypothetical protein